MEQLFPKWDAQGNLGGARRKMFYFKWILGKVLSTHPLILQILSWTS